MSDTPRTDQNTLDALKKKLHGMAISYDRLVLTDFARELERENAALREDKERLVMILKDVVAVTEPALHAANNDGADWDVEFELSAARAAIDAARKKEAK